MFLYKIIKNNIVKIFLLYEEKQYKIYSNKIKELKEYT